MTNRFPAIQMAVVRGVLWSLALLAGWGSVGCHSLGKPPVYYDIGVVHKEVATHSPDAQLWFDRGLALSYGFNHEEAIVCFDRAVAIDPNCIMAYWGKAYALGPNYNNVEMTEEAAVAAVAALDEARRRYGDGSPLEQGLCEALSRRYSVPTPEDRSALELAYANAMRDLHEQFPDDPDVAALTAEALMMLSPWTLWSPEGEAAAITPEIRELLEGALERWPAHPALCHLYIHTMEAGPFAIEATAAAEQLETLTPGLGHLVHMPSHIYTWTGRYDDVIRVNVEAVALDDAFVEHAGRENFYSLYRLHNYHFVAYGAMFDGQRELALQYSRRLVEEVPEGLLREIPDFLDIFTATPLHVMVRFGMWEQILDEPEPADELLAHRPVWHYARGVALASLGRVEEALQEQAAFLAAKEAVPETRMLFNNPVAQILNVAESVLAGEIEYRRGNFDVAFGHLREAVRRDKLLNYDEPWGWMEPARHPLGALLVEQGHYAEAEAVYRADLERYPENGWALHGLAECLEKTGRAEEAGQVRARFDKAWKRADVEIHGSCFCRTQ